MRGAYGRINRKSCAQRFTAALTGAMPASQRVGAILRSLHRALIFRDKAIADGERPFLVIFQFLNRIGRCESGDMFSFRDFWQSLSGS